MGDFLNTVCKSKLNKLFKQSTKQENKYSSSLDTHTFTHKIQ